MTTFEILLLRISRCNGELTLQEKHDLLAEFIPQKVAISVKNYKFIGKISLPENNANKFTGENFRKKLV
jgi:hypothetical protein